MSKRNPHGNSIPLAVLRSDNNKFSWLSNIKNLSIGELVELYAYSEAIVDTVREPLLVLDKTLHVRTANRAFFRNFKMSQKETYGKYIYELNGGEWNIPELKKLLENILPRNSHFDNFEVSHNFDRLGQKIMLLNARRIVLEENKTQLILLAIEDVTEKRNLEKRKDEFLGMASHELKNPLTSIKAYIQILIKRLDKDQKNIYFLQQIERQADKMHNLIADLLDIRKIEAGKLAFEKQIFDLTSLIQKVVAEFQLLTDKHYIIREGDEKIQIFGNKDRIEQVLVNLLTNAIKYSPDGETITIRSKKKKEMVEVSVQDFGIGIVKSKQKFLFSPYYTAEVKDVGRNVSAGLGLYIASEIIKRHDGKMWLLSKKGKGSTFFFTLPIVKRKS